MTPPGRRSGTTWTRRRHDLARGSTSGTLVHAIGGKRFAFLVGQYNWRSSRQPDRASTAELKRRSTIPRRGRPRGRPTDQAHGRAQQTASAAASALASQAAKVGPSIRAPGEGSNAPSDKPGPASSGSTVMPGACRAANARASS